VNEIHPPLLRHGFRQLKAEALTFCFTGGAVASANTCGDFGNLRVVRSRPPGSTAIGPRYWGYQGRLPPPSRPTPSLASLWIESRALATAEQPGRAQPVGPVKLSDASCCGADGVRSW